MTITAGLKVGPRESKLLAARKCLGRDDLCGYADTVVDHSQPASSCLQLTDDERTQRRHRSSVAIDFNGSSGRDSSLPVPLFALNALA